MSIYIQHTKSIAPVNTYENGVLDALLLEKPKNEAVHPDYKSVLKISGTRRMSTIIKMALTAGFDAMKSDDVDAIIVASGLGNLTHTIKFLDQTVINKNGPIPPTQFIQSTHNTISGQLALNLQCKAYNMTHVQGGVSFETALMDAFLRFDQDHLDHVLIGAADEYNELMKRWGEQAHLNMDEVGEGSTFFHLSREKNDSTTAIQDCTTLSARSKQQLENIIAEVDVVLYVRSSLYADDVLQFLPDEKTIDMTPKTKVYWSNSALVLAFAAELLDHPERIKDFKDTALEAPQKILVVNNYRNRFLGCTIIEKL